MKIEILQIKKAKTLSGEHDGLTLSSVSLSMTKALFKEMVAGATPRELETMAQGINDSFAPEKYEELRVRAMLLLTELNNLTGRKYRALDAKKRPTENLKLIIYLLKDGRDYFDILEVINHKVTKWLHDKKMSMYLRPITLFNKAKFDCYLNEVGT